MLKFPGIDLDGLRIVAQIGNQRIHVACDPLQCLQIGGGTVVEATEIPEQAAAFHKGLRRTQLLVIQATHGSCRELDETAAVGCRLVPLIEILLLSRGKSGRGDLRHFLTELCDPLLAARCGVEFLQGATRRGHGRAAFQIGLAFRECLAEAVEEHRLLSAREERLVVVGAMEVDKPCAQFFEDREIAGAAIDELPACTLRGDGAFQDESAILAGVDTRFLEQRVDLGGLIQCKARLDACRGCPGSDNPTVGALSQKELQRPEDHRLSRARLTGYRRETGGKLPLQLLDKGQISDSERSEHRRHGGDYATGGREVEALNCCPKRKQTRS